MAIKLEVRIGPGVMCPSWYGVAYIDYAANTAVCYPVPLNLFVMWGRKLYDKICFPNVTSGDYARGYHQGFQEGREYERKIKGPTSIH